MSGRKARARCRGLPATEKGAERPTVTDASLVLGHIDPAFFLGGTMKLEADLAAKAIQKGCRASVQAGLEEAAAAIIRLATENMVGAIEQITIHQGIDPRDAILVGGGGAAGLNSVAIARRLGCKTVVIPEVGAALSAAGALMSDLHADFRSLFFTVTDRFDFDGANATLKTLTDEMQRIHQGRRQRGDRLVDRDTSSRRATATRFGRSISRWKSSASNRRRTSLECARRSTGLHEEVFAFRDPSSEVEFVGWRATARCKFRQGKLGRLGTRSCSRSELTPRRGRRISNGKGTVNARVLLFESMKPNVTVQGPGHHRVSLHHRGDRGRAPRW